MATIKELRGNIFLSSCQTLVNTVNCDGYMGKGIALEFKFRFPDMYHEYERYCSDGVIQPGVLHLWKKTTPWVLNFPTKKHWKFPSKMDYIERGLDKFALTYATKGITSVAFPQLGTSLGGLNWTEVRSLMLDRLSTLPNLDVEIYQYDPSAPDPLFDSLLQSIHRFGINDYKETLGINGKPARSLIAAIGSGDLRSMQDFQDLEAVGEGTLKKLYTFASRSETKRLVTSAERQPSLAL